MFITIITMKRPMITVPYYFESVDGKTYYEPFNQARATASGFHSKQVERSADDLTIVHRVVWDSKASKFAFEVANASLFSLISSNLKEYNSMHEIQRDVVEGES